MSKEKTVKQDQMGFELLKDAVLDLLNRFPALNGRSITLGGLLQDSGISMEPNSGALVISEQKDILGTTWQMCQFPFFVVYRSYPDSEYKRINIMEFLDDLGAWLSKEPVNINGEEHILTEYPAISDRRKITDVVRFNSYALEPNDNNTQDWVIPITVNYTHYY